MKHVPVYFVEIFSEAGGSTDCHFLFPPTPPDLIGALQDEIDGFHAANAEANLDPNSDEAEHQHRGQNQPAQ